MSVDPDGDGIPTINDNCPGTFNPDQTDSDGDGFGNVCDCDGSISPTSGFFPARNAAGIVNLTTPSGCTWTVSTSDDWIIITSAQSGAGSEPITFELRENAGSARSGTISIGGLAFTVVQAGVSEGCSYSISPTTMVFASTGGMATISVTASPGCAWEAVSNVGWITIASGSPGIGSGSVNYVVAPNTGNTRAGKITIAGKTLAIKQAHP